MQVAPVRVRNKKPLLKRNCSQRQGKGHWPCVLHKAVSSAASRTGGAAPGSWCFSSAPFGVTPDLAAQDVVPSPQDWAAQLPPPLASHFPSCLPALLLLLADRWGSRWSARVRFQTLLWCALVLSQDLRAQHAPCSASAFSVAIKIKGPLRVTAKKRSFSM